MKLNLGQGGVKGLAARHVEKLVFGLALVAVVAFVYLGYSLKSGMEAKTPDNLRQLAQAADQHIKSPTFQELKNERTPRSGEGGQYESRVREASIATDSAPYTTLSPWSPAQGKPGSKREDPSIFPPMNVETYAVTGALCLTPKDATKGPLDDLENAPAPEAKKKKPKKQRAMRGGYGSDGGSAAGGNPYGDGFEQNPYGDQDDKAKRKKKENKPTGPERRYPPSKTNGYRPGGTFGGGGSDGYMGSGSPGAGSPGAGSPGAGSPGAGSPGAGTSGAGSGGASLGAPGDDTSGGGGYAGYMGGGPSSGSGPALASSARLIAVKALAPYRQQVEEFKKALGDAVGYDPQRDQPRIIFFQAQRADMTDDPQKEPTDADWKDIMNPKKAASLVKSQRWHGTIQEVVDPACYDENLTMATPPIMLRDTDELMLHSETPRASTRPMFQAPDAGAGEGGESGADETGSEPGADADLPGGGPGRAGPGYPGSGYPGPGGSGYPGSGSPGPGGSGYPGSGSPGPGGSGYPGSGSSGPGGSGYPGSGYPGMGGSGYPGSGGYGDGSSGEGYPGSGGYGMGPGYYGSSSGTADIVQYKLIRFFDMTAEPGRVYRYRVRLLVEDPNNPNTDPANGRVWAAPRRKSLSNKVIARLAQQTSTEPAGKDADTSGEKATGTGPAKAPWYVFSDWSEPSDPVTLPSTSRLYVGDVAAARTSVGKDNTVIPEGETRGTVVPVVWNDSLAVDVSNEVRAYRGSFMRVRDQFDILDPISLVIKILKDFDFQNDFLVVDIRGGEDLPGDRKYPVTSVGEFAIVDDQGNLVVHNELDDYFKVRLYTFKDEVARKSGAYYDGAEGTGYPGGGPGSGGASGYPGMGPGAGGASGFPGMRPPGPGGAAPR